MGPVVCVHTHDLTPRPLPVGDNLTLLPVVLEAALTKVLAWPKKRAVVGYVGLAELDDLPMDEWLRLFIAETKDFENLDSIASLLSERIQSSMGTSRGQGLIHLGGFEQVDEVMAPRFILVTNVPGLERNGSYMPAIAAMEAKDELRRLVTEWVPPCKYPHEIRERLAAIESHGSVYWLNNGYRYDLFNYIKGFLLPPFMIARNSLIPAAPQEFELSDWATYAKIGVDLYGSFFRHFLPPQDRVVGGGVDAIAIRWPE